MFAKSWNSHISVQSPTWQYSAACHHFQLLHQYLGLRHIWLLQQIMRLQSPYYNQVKPSKGHMTAFNSVLGNFHQKKDSWSHAKTHGQPSRQWIWCMLPVFTCQDEEQPTYLPKRKEYLDTENLNHLRALGKTSERPIPNGKCNVGYQWNPAHLRLCELCGLATVIKEFN